MRRATTSCSLHDLRNYNGRRNLPLELLDSNHRRCGEICEMYLIVVIFICMCALPCLLKVHSTRLYDLSMPRTASALLRSHAACSHLSVCHPSFLHSVSRHLVLACSKGWQLRLHCCLHVSNDLFGVCLDDIPLGATDGIWREERRNKANRIGAVFEEVTRIVKVDTRGWVECKHWKRCRDCLDPHVAACNAGKDLLDGRTSLVRIVRLGRRLAARDDHDVVHRTPRHYLRHEDGRNEELRSRVHGTLCIINVHDGAAAHHDLAVVLCAEVGDAIKAARRRQREFDDFKATADRRFHCRSALFCLRCPEHRACAVHLEGV
mmetsp:Transcript_26622/g.57472  ORF Transcript_26622/g.57472 Transcript_26622/m.57472 type:complete len:320 (+) Transcript_26622:52-1011(+)